MNADKLKLLIAEGEGLTVEFKEKYTPKIDRDIVAMANSRGGFILLGVNDDRRVTGEKLTNQMKAEIASLARNCDPQLSITKISQIGDVVALEVPEGSEKPYSCSSGYFRRLDGMTQKMTQKEVRLVFRAAADRSFESLPCKDFSPEHIQLGTIRSFLKEAGAALKVSRANLPSFLSSLGLHDGGAVNNAGALMFAADINKFIPHSETIMAAFKGVEKVHIYDRLDARTDLLSQFNAAMGFLKKHLNSLFHRMGKVERLGTGIKRMKDLMREAGLKAPEFASDTFFHAVFHRDPQYSLKLSGGKPGAKTRETTRETARETARETTREKILAAIKANPAVTASELSKLLHVTAKGVEWNLKKLKKEGFLKRIGADFGGHWQVIPRPKADK